MKGIDAAQPVGDKAAAFVADGIALFSRYYSHNAAKNLSYAEAQQISNAGGVIVSVWEARGDEYASFTAEAGAADATAAMEQARACGQPAGTVIFFAVDFDATQQQVDGGISDYFDAAKSMLGTEYMLGSYGSPLVNALLIAKGLTARSWQAQSPGWAGNHNAPKDLTQGPEEMLLGIDVDTDSTDEAVAKLGAWSLPISSGAVASQQEPASSAPIGGSIEVAVRQLQTALGGLDVDGIAGPLTIAALRRWQATR